MAKLLECVPNYSEGRDLDKVEQIVGCFRGRQGVKLLDYSSDADHNRTVVTVIGEPEALVAAVVDSVGKALELIDMTNTRASTRAWAPSTSSRSSPSGRRRWRTPTRRRRLPRPRRAKSSASPSSCMRVPPPPPTASTSRRSAAASFEGMAEKMKDQAHWKPDYGPATIHPTGGVTAIGARPPLVAYNVDLDTSDLAVADKIVHMVRHINGGFRYCKANGVELKERGIVQVSMNLTDYSKTAIYRVLETIRMEARRFGVNVLGSEIVGLVPMQALVDCAEYYLQLENFSVEQVLESRLLLSALIDRTSPIFWRKRRPRRPRRAAAAWRRWRARFRRRSRRWSPA